MNLKRLIIAFLAPRYPAAYTEEAVAQRLNASQMLDWRCSAGEVADALRALHRVKMVELRVDPVDGSAVWQATEEGIKRWVLEGRVTVV